MSQTRHMDPCYHCERFVNESGAQGDCDQDKPCDGIESCSNHIAYLVTIGCKDIFLDRAGFKQGVYCYHKICDRCLDFYIVNKVAYCKCGFYIQKWVKHHRRKLGY